MERRVGLAPFMLAGSVGLGEKLTELEAGLEDAAADEDEERVDDVEEKRWARDGGLKRVVAARWYSDSSGDGVVDGRMRFARFAARELLVVMRNLRLRKSAGSIHNRSADRASALSYKVDCGRRMLGMGLSLKRPKLSRRRFKVSPPRSQLAGRRVLPV